MAVDVSIVPCGSYDEDVCREALTKALAPFGGLDWVTEGMCVVIKVNLVSAMKPEQAATTHPTLLCELTKMLVSRGAHVVLGDSPGGLYTSSHVNHVYDLSGMRACEAVGAELNQDFSQKDASFPEAVCAKKFTYTAYLDRADAIIDFCKLKTHGMMGLTNAVKNYFGVVPGTMKPEYHYKYPQIADFSNMLIDLGLYFKPRICICDAVVGMEGNGPTQGSPRKIGCILASESASKLDLLAAKLIGLKIDDVPTLQAARVRGLIPDSAEELEIAGDAAPFLIPDFKTMPAQSSVFFHKAGTGVIGKIVDTFLFRALTPCPKVKKNECIGCGKCAKICPAKAITMQNKLPVIDRKACIHCFCCQEFCPKGAMGVYRPAIARLLNK
mgnify:FL=1